MNRTVTITGGPGYWSAAVVCDGEYIDGAASDVAAVLLDWIAAKYPDAIRA